MGYLDWVDIDHARVSNYITSCSSLDVANWSYSLGLQIMLDVHTSTVAWIFLTLVTGLGSGSYTVRPTDESASS